MKEYSSFLESLEKIFSEGAVDLSLMASGIGALLIFVNLGLNYVNSYIKSDGLNGKPVFFEIPELKRSIASYMMIFILPALLLSIKTIGVNLADLIALDKNELYEAWVVLVLTGESSIWNKLSVLMLSYGSFTIFSWLLIFIKTAVTIFINVTLSFAISVAPLAAAFSILNFLKEQMLHLIKIAMNLSFVALTLGIIDIIMVQVLHAITELQGLNNPLIYNTLAGSVMFVIIVLYIMSIWLTSLYVGSPAAGAIMSTAATVAAVAAGAAMQVVSMGAAVVTGGASLLGGGGGSGSGISDIVDKAKEDIGASNTDNK